MKRDMDLVRNILLEVEAAPAGESIQVLRNVGQHSHPAVAEHVELLEESGLIDAEIIKTGQGRAYLIRRLTMDGHEWLDAARDPGIWNQAKQFLAKKRMEGVGLSVMQELLTALVRQTLFGGG